MSTETMNNSCVGNSERPSARSTCSLNKHYSACFSLFRSVVSRRRTGGGGAAGGGVCPSVQLWWGLRPGGDKWRRTSGAPAGKLQPPNSPLQRRWSKQDSRTFCSRRYFYHLLPLQGSTLRAAACRQTHCLWELQACQDGVEVLFLNCVFMLYRDKVPAGQCGNWSRMSDNISVLRNLL